MHVHAFQLFAGSFSCGIFIFSNLPMLLKAFRTRDLKSYSLGQILLGNLGNCLYWIYLISLPFGPIWFIQGFFTLTSLLMLLGYLHYERGWALHFRRTGNLSPDKRLRA
jgi:uncharacterized protein with PQ loop repeat